MVTLEVLRAELRDEIVRRAAHRGAHSVRVFGSVLEVRPKRAAIWICWLVGSRAAACWITLDLFRIWKSCSG